MPRQAKDIRPRSQQIAADLRALITAGDQAPGTKLQSTQQLMDRFSVTSQTVQNALGILKAEGYIEGRPGKGVYVRETQQETITPGDYAQPRGAGQPYAWITEATRRGQSGGSMLLDVAEVEAPAQVAKAFGLDPADLVVKRTQVLTLDDQPAELAHLYYPAKIARGTALAERRKIRGGSPAVLAGLGLEPEKFEDVISTRPPTVEEFIALELPQEVPILRTFRVARTADGRPVEAQVLAKAGHRHELRYRWPMP